MSEPIDEWTAMPIMLTVEDAARVLRISRSKAYEIGVRLVGSEMCIRDSCISMGTLVFPEFRTELPVLLRRRPSRNPIFTCLLYTSDAADE